MTLLGKGVKIIVTIFTAYIWRHVIAALFRQQTLPAMPLHHLISKWVKNEGFAIFAL